MDRDSDFTAVILVRVGGLESESSGERLRVDWTSLVCSDKSVIDLALDSYVMVTIVAKIYSFSTHHL